MTDLSLHTAGRIVGRRKKRLGRGDSSGKGTYSGRGIKGQSARSGGKRRPGFEGGRMPLMRQMPKTGGFNSHRPKIIIVNIADLERLFVTGAVISLRELKDKQLVPSRATSVKILGNGKLTKALTVRADRFSATARQAIEGAGGKAQLIS